MDIASIIFFVSGYSLEYALQFICALHLKWSTGMISFSGKSFYLCCSVLLQKKKNPQLALLFVQLHYSEVTFQEQVCDVQNVIFFCALILVTYDILLTLYL